jgi:hypothetical protein
MAENDEIVREVLSYQMKKTEKKSNQQFIPAFLCCDGETLPSHH